MKGHRKEEREKKQNRVCNTMIKFDNSTSFQNLLPGYFCANHQDCLNTALTHRTTYPCYENLRGNNFLVQNRTFLLELKNL